MSVAVEDELREDWNLPGLASKGKRVLIMGVLNVTPDSFFDGGLYLDPARAALRACEMVREGADLIDVGGESSRPGSSLVSAEEEMRRVLPVIERLSRELPGFPLSVDTTKSAVAREAIRRGVSIVNDISALCCDAGMAGTVAEAGVGVILMHLRGTPQTMQQNPLYRDCIAEISDFLRERLSVAVSAGIPRERIWLDPGIGFGKTVRHNLEILGRLEELAALGRPLVVGTSRKSFIGEILGRGTELPPGERLEGTLASSLWALMKGARVLRVHDVGPSARAVAVWEAISRQGSRDLPPLADDVSA